MNGKKDSKAVSGRIRSHEMDVAEFGNDRFACRCPRCGMRFNP